MKMTMGTTPIGLMRVCGIASLGAVMAISAGIASAQTGYFGGQTGGRYGVQTQPGIGGAVEQGIRGAIRGESFSDAARQGLRGGRQTLTDPQSRYRSYQQPYQQPYQQRYRQPYGAQYQQPYQQYGQP